MKIGLVTPVLNSEKYLFRTISSVLQQRGDFDLRYHIQDAGSTDGTQDIIKDVFSAINRNHLPVLCNSLVFTASSQKDSGMYSGINRGFARIFSDFQPDLLFWINSDDVLSECSIANVCGFFAANPDIDWISGKTVHIDEQDKVIHERASHEYKRFNLAAGLHDGQTMPFVTQEACVWTRRLWESVGRLDDRWKFAADYEFWSRIARNGFELNSVEFTVAQHRKRRGQLSELPNYADEVRVIGQNL